MRTNRSIREKYAEQITGTNRGSLCLQPSVIPTEKCPQHVKLYAQDIVKHPEAMYPPHMNPCMLLSGSRDCTNNFRNSSSRQFHPKLRSPSSDTCGVSWLQLRRSWRYPGSQLQVLELFGRKSGVFCWISPEGNQLNSGDA